MITAGTGLSRGTSCLSDILDRRAFNSNLYLYHRRTTANVVDDDWKNLQPHRFQRCNMRSNATVGTFLLPDGTVIPRAATSRTNIGRQGGGEEEEEEEESHPGMQVLHTF